MVGSPLDTSTSAGPSRQPSPNKARPPKPLRSFSLTARFKSRQSDMHKSGPPSPESPDSFKSFSSSIHRTNSGEAQPQEKLTTQDASSTTLVASLPSSSPLFKAAYAKLSRKDQEAMRKLRDTLGSQNNSSSSLSPGLAEPTSPGLHKVPSNPTRPINSRQSTLSRLTVPIDVPPGSVEPEEPVRLVCWI